MMLFQRQLMVNLKIFDIQPLKPWEKYTPLKKADYIIEFEENKIKNKLKKGDEIEFI